MRPHLHGLRFETACGVFEVRHRMEPEKDVDRNRWEYWLLFKWIDPHDAENKATPEFQMHLDLYEEDMLADDAEAKLIKALLLWIDGAPYCDDPLLSFRSDSAILKKRA